MNKRNGFNTTYKRRCSIDKKHSNVRHNNIYKRSENMSGEGIWEQAQQIYKSAKPVGKFLWKHKEKVAKLGELGYKLVKKKKDKSSSSSLFDNIDLDDIKKKAGKVSSIASDTFKKAGDIYDSGIVQKAINFIPDSDENARAQYPGERHALLKLKNGKMGRANYMGPGTQIIERLKRGDPPRTYSDGVAKIHDIDYYLASGASDEATKNALIRQADNRMIEKLNRASRKSLDNNININLGRGIIASKTKLEDLGIMRKGSFGSKLQEIKPEDKALLLKQKKDAEIAGYGPSKMLKLNYMKHMKKKQKGKGLRLAGQRGKGLGIAGGGLNLSGGFLSLIIAGIAGIAEAVSAISAATVATAVVTGAASAVGGLAVNALVDAFDDDSKEEFSEKMKKMKAWVDLAKKEIARYEKDPETEKKMGKDFLKNFKKAVDLKENKYLALQAKGSGLNLSGRGVKAYPIKGYGFEDNLLINSAVKKMRGYGLINKAAEELAKIHMKKEIVKQNFKQIYNAIPKNIIMASQKVLEKDPNKLKAVLEKLAPVVKNVVDKKLNLPNVNIPSSHLANLAIQKIK